MPGGIDPGDDPPPIQPYKNIHMEDVIFVESSYSNNINQNLNNEISNTNLKNAEKNNQQGQTSLSTDNLKTTELNTDMSGKKQSRFIDINNRFKNADKGPFFIFVEHKSLNLGRLHPMKLGEKLSQLSEYEKHITEISGVGRNRIKVLVDSGNAANKLVADSFFEKNDLIAYIPNYLTEKKGIVRFVDTSLSEETLFNIIKSDIAIKKVQRLHRMVTEGEQVKRIPRQMIIVTFSGITIPQYIYINKVRCTVDTYIQPVMQCHRCLRFGHSFSQCKGKKRCKKCGSDNEDECVACCSYCIFCKNNSHQSTYKECPEYLKQKRTKEAMALHNISFKEAEGIIDNPAYTSIEKKNRFAPLINCNFEFPPLSQHPKPKTSSYDKPIPSQPQPTNPPKKRKTQDTTPHFPPIQREYNTSFSGGPVFNSTSYKDNDNIPQNVNVELLKNKLCSSVGNFLIEIIGKMIPSASAHSIDDLNLESSLNNIWNARSAFSNHLTLKQLIVDETFNIGLISETWYKPGYNINFKGYNIIRKDRQNGKGGVAILVSHGISYKVIKFNNNFNNKIEVCGINIMINKKNISIVSIYRPPNIKATVTDYVNLFNQIPCNSCVIGGDFNSHHGLWGSSINNQAGNVLVETLDHFPHLSVANSGRATRLTSPNNTNSVVDITMISADLISSVTWDVCTDTYGSDHYPIKITFPNFLINSTMVYPIHKWSTEDTNWNLFGTLIDEYFVSIPHFSSTNDMITYLVEAITNAANITCKKKVPFIPRKPKSPPWWDNSCSNLSLQRNAALKNYKRNMTNSNFIEYKRIDALCKREFKKKARDSWKNYCSKLTRQSNPSEIWRRVNKIQGTHSGNRYNDPDSMEMFINQLAPDNVSLPPLTAGNIEPHFFNTDINLYELEANIKSTSNTAPGIDGISYIMIKHLPPSAKLFLCDIFNNILIKGQNCDALKNSLVIPIPKSTDGNSFRPISLMSCILKTLERIIKNRLEWWLEKYKLIPDSQYGFRRGKGTTECIAQLVTDIQLNFSRNDYLMTLYLDISAAYDHVNLHILHEQLLSLQIPPNIATNITNLFLNRNVFVRVNDGTIGPRKLDIGIPQGSVLSPLLFNVYTLDFHRIMDTRITVLQYADDFCIYGSNKGYNQGIVDLNYAMHCSKNYFLNLGLDISPEKSAVVIYTRHRVSNISNLCLASSIIPVLPQYKYLGVTLDTKLNWNGHINEGLIKAEKSLNILKITCKRSWGSDPKIALLFYRSYVRSILDYGSIFYDSAANSRLVKLDRVQYKALRLVLGAFKSTPTCALLAECNEPPLHLRRRYLAHKFLLKNLSISNNKLGIKVATLASLNLTLPYWQNKKSPLLADVFASFTNLKYISEEETLPFFKESYEISYCKPQVIFPKYENAPNNNQILQEVTSKYTNSYKIFTDGSKSHKGVGSAFFVRNKEISFSYQLNENCSIYTAESLAINKGLDWAIENYISYQTILILSDSQSVLTAISNPYKHIMKNKILTNILGNVVKLQALNREVIFIWVKGHSGIIGNETADSVARNITGPSADYLPYQDLITLAKGNMRKSWEEEWRQIRQSSNYQYCRIYNCLTTKPSFLEFPYSRQHFVTYIRCLFGHGAFKSMLYKMKFADSPFCDCDGNIGDINHWLFQCHHNLRAINFLTNKLGEVNTFQPLDSTSLLYLVTKNEKHKQIFWEFIRLCRVKI